MEKLLEQPAVPLGADTAEREPTSLEILKGAYGIEVSKREEKLLVKGKGDMQTYLLSQRDGDISVPDGCTHTLRSPPAQEGPPPSHEP